MTLIVHWPNEIEDDENGGVFAIGTVYYIPGTGWVMYMLDAEIDPFKVEFGCDDVKIINNDYSYTCLTETDMKFILKMAKKARKMMEKYEEGEEK